MYSKKLLYLTWGGQIGSAGSGADIWQSGLHLGIIADGADPSNLSQGQVAELLGSIIADFHVNPYVNNSAGAVLKWAKCVGLTREGGYDTEPVVAELTTGLPGAATTPRGAPQLSMAITLYSGQTLGAANFGRWYTPWYGGYAQQTTGRLTSGDTGGLATAAKGFINDLNSLLHSYQPLGLEVVIASRKGSGTTKRPYGVKVGDVVDTQRRRRNRIAETYAAEVLGALTP